MSARRPHGLKILAMEHGMCWFHGPNMHTVPRCLVDRKMDAGVSNGVVRSFCLRRRRMEGESATQGKGLKPGSWVGSSSVLFNVFAEACSNEEKKTIGLLYLSCLNGFPVSLRCNFLLYYYIK